MSAAPQSKPIAIFYCGTNGSGKSTLRSIYNDTGVRIHIDTDALARKLNPNNPKLADLSAAKYAITLYKNSIELNESFSMESTLSGKSAANRILQAKNAGFEVHIRYVGLTSPDLNVQRVHERAAKGGHFIDDDLVRKRYNESLQNLLSVYRDVDFVEIWDNSGSEVNKIATIENGKLVIVSQSEIPAWTSDLIERIRPTGLTNSIKNLAPINLSGNDQLWNNFKKSFGDDIDNEP